MGLWVFSLNVGSASEAVYCYKADAPLGLCVYNPFTPQRSGITNLVGCGMSNSPSKTNNPPSDPPVYRALVGINMSDPHPFGHPYLFPPPPDPHMDACTLEGSC